MSKFVAKFYLTGVESQRQIDITRDNEGQTKRTAGESCVVRMSAAQGEPFGKYTPNGTQQMTILNSAVAEILRQRWEKYVANADPEAKPPAFYVEYIPEEEYGKY